MPKVASPPLPLSVTAGQLGGAIGVTERVILGRKSDRRLPLNDDGSIDLGALLKAGVDAFAAAAKAGSPAGMSPLDTAKIEVLNEQRDKLIMLNQQMRGDAVLAEDLDVVVGAIVDGIRARVLALPTRAAPLVLGLPGLAEVRDKLTELVHEVCASLAATEIAHSVKDRARRRAGRSEDSHPDIQEAGASS